MLSNVASQIQIMSKMFSKPVTLKGLFCINDQYKLKEAEGCQYAVHVVLKKGGVRKITNCALKNKNIYILMLQPLTKPNKFIFYSMLF